MSPLLIGLIVAGVGLLLAVVGLVARKQAGRIASAPFLKTGEAARAGGEASAQGTTVVQLPVSAPCTGTPSVYYRLLLEMKIKEQKGTQTTTSWKKLVEHGNGTVFAVDDGSGPVWIQPSDAMDGQLEQTFSGPPPGGPGLGALAGFMPPNPPPLHHGQQIVEYRATEKVIRAGAPVFVLGAAQNGALVQSPSGKLLVSTRGRDALIGSAKRRALACFVAGGLATVGGAAVAIAQPGVAPGCGALVDEQAACKVSSQVITQDMLQPDGSRKPGKIRRAELAWQVTKEAKYALEARDPRKRDAAPSIQVEDAIGLPMNLDLGLDLGAGRYSTKTKTKKLAPGKYTIYVFSSESGPSDLDIEIHPITE